MWPFNSFSQLTTRAVQYVTNIFTVANDSENDSDIDNDNQLDRCSLSSADDERECDSDCSLCISYSYVTSKSNSIQFDDSLNSSQHRPFYKQFLERGSQRSSISRPYIENNNYEANNNLQQNNNEFDFNNDDEEVPLELLQRQINQLSQSSSSSQNSSKQSKKSYCGLHKNSASQNKLYKSSEQSKNNRQGISSGKRLKPNYGMNNSQVISDFNKATQNNQTRKSQSPLRRIQSHDQIDLQNIQSHYENDGIDVIDLENVRSNLQSQTRDQNKRSSGQQSIQIITPQFTQENPFTSCNQPQQQQQYISNPINFTQHRRIMQNPLIHQDSKKRKYDDIKAATQTLSFLNRSHNDIGNNNVPTYLKSSPHQNQIQLNEKADGVFDFDQYNKSITQSKAKELNNNLRTANSQILIDLTDTNEEEKQAVNTDNIQRYEKPYINNHHPDISNQILQRRTQNNQNLFTLSHLKQTTQSNQKCEQLLSDLNNLTLKDGKQLREQLPLLNINEVYENQINQYLSDESIIDDAILIKNDELNYSLSKKDLKRLELGQWFNDEIVNAYIELVIQASIKRSYIQNQSKRPEEQGICRTVILKTFFYTNMEDMIKRGDFNTQKIERSLKKVKDRIMDCDQILIPINQIHQHWYLVVIDIKQQKYLIVDSMYHSDIKGMLVVKNLRRFFDDYLSQQRNTDPLLWTMKILDSIPKQTNGSDCGLCLCLNMRHVALGSIQSNGSNKSENEQVSKADQFDDDWWGDQEFKYGIEADGFSEKYRKQVGVELIQGKLL